MDLLRRQSPGGAEDLAQEMSSRLQQAMVELLQASTTPPKTLPLSVRPWVIVFLGRERRRENDDDRQTRCPISISREESPPGGCGYLSCGRHRATRGMGKTSGRRRRSNIAAGADPSAVVYDGIQAAKSRGIDVPLIDTAGRLHTKVHLIEELKRSAGLFPENNRMPPMRPFWCWMPRRDRTVSSKPAFSKKQRILPVLY